MKKSIWIVIIVFIISNAATAQPDLSKYYYVLVPQQFEFLKGKISFN